MNPWLIGASLLYLGGSYVWRKLHEKSEPPPRPDRVSLPRTDEGAPIPFIIGRTRVSSPILAWASQQFALWVPDDTGSVSGSFQQSPERFLYFRNLHFAIGFSMGDGEARIYEMWLGTQRLGKTSVNFVDVLTGDGNFEPDTTPAAWSSIYEPDKIGSPSFTSERTDASRYIEPFEATNVEFLNGNPNQKIVDDDGTPLTYLGKHMTTNTGTGVLKYTGDADADEVPSYRGLLSVFLFGNRDSNQLYALLGGPSMQAPSFEVSSWSTDHPQLGTYARVGFDSNPVNAIHAILTHPKMLNLDESSLDMASFQGVQYTLHTETHGYSRTFENGETAEEMLGEILQQIGGVLWQDRATGKLKLRLIRADYNPATIPLIDRSNASDLDLDSIGSTDLVNKVRVTFRNRAKDYETDSVSAQDLASVFASGKTREEVIDFPGCCTPGLAQALADRELAELSRPIMTGTVLVSRKFYRLAPGDAVMVRWTSPDVASIVFRVTSIDYGTLEQSAIRLGLVQDSGYVYRARTPQPGGFGGLTPPNPPTTISGGGGVL